MSKDIWTLIPKSISLVKTGQDRITTFYPKPEMDTFHEKLKAENQRAMEWLSHIDSLHLEGGFAEILGWKEKADLFEKLFGDIEFDIVSKKWLDRKLEKADLYDKFKDCMLACQKLEKIELWLATEPMYDEVDRFDTDDQVISWAEFETWKEKGKDALNVEPEGQEKMEGESKDG